MTDSSNSSTASDTNTKKRQCSPYKHARFTLNNYTFDDVRMILETCSNSSRVKKYIFQEEIGEEKGTPHLQGYIEFTVKLRPMGIFKYTKDIHWSPAYKPYAEAIKYCCDPAKLLPGGKCHRNFRPPRNIVDHYYEHDPKWWQLELEDLMQQEPDPRKVYWYFDEIGGTGKTTYARHLELKYEALRVSGNATDIKCALKTHVDNVGDIWCVVFDFTRTQEGKISYTAIEDVKNATCFSGKYESSPVIYEFPHVICFANFPPDERALSRDRWVIKDISEEHIVDYF